MTISRKDLPFLLALACLLAAGIFMRVHPTSAFNGINRPGRDEGEYANYLSVLDRPVMGISHYGLLVKAYESNQDETTEAIVHPLRMGYLVPSYFWMEMFHRPVRGETYPQVMEKCLAALHDVSALAAVLHLFVACAFAWRAGGRMAALGVTALVAFAPLQVCLAQRALVDGVYGAFATLCFWLFWENMRAPNRWPWLAAYTIALFLCVMTKEYSAFVAFAFCGVMLANFWLRIGTVTPKLFAATAIAPALAVLVLVYYAGGSGKFLHLYLSEIAKSRVLPYAIKTQDGPWSRYLLDFLVITPAVLLLAVGRVFQLKKKDSVELYCALFWILSYLPMACLTYGMSLRFAAFWDVPLCWLAYSQLRILAERMFQHRTALAMTAAVLLVCGIELREYVRIFRSTDPFPVYDPITVLLLKADKILK